MRIVIFLIATFSLCIISEVVVKNGFSHKKEPDLTVATVATGERDGFKLFKRSAKIYGYDIKVFGMGQQWTGGTMETVGGGHKISLLKQGLKKYKNHDNLLIMIVNSYDVVVTDGPDALLEKFKKFDARVVFSAGTNIWPDKLSKDKYPKVKTNEKRFLNSGGFIGYAKEINEILNYRSIGHQEDDQLYYTEIFLNRGLRNELNIKLDTRCEIFQHLDLVHGQIQRAKDEITLKYKGAHSYLYNVKTGTSPLVMHGNGPIKSEFYRLANYLADGWTPTTGCQSCDEDLLEELYKLQEKEYPTVMIALFVKASTPFIQEFFERVALLDYPKYKIDIFIHNRETMHNKDVKTFVDNNENDYRSVVVLDSSENLSLHVASNRAIDKCLDLKCKYFFEIDSNVQITNPSLLVALIHQNRSIISPMMRQPETEWTNFWGDLSSNHFYARSEDYMDIVYNKKIGLWNVPYVSGVLLVQGHQLLQLKKAYTYMPDYDTDMSFCEMARAKGIFMYVTNREHWGHLVTLEYYETNHLHNELFDIINNPVDWNNRYIHKDYEAELEKKDLKEFAQPCPDVYWFPVLTDRFCDEFIAECENYGQWSGGKNEDPRLRGGYEQVPTVDIHLNQIGFEKQWMHILKEYIQPLQKKVFSGYLKKPSQNQLSFIVRYKPDEQPFLLPHHDAGVYTVNIALNRAGIDYEGGGCRFIRYNCSVTATRKGWIMMHPGRLTHFHEGLRTTKGTRYIMIAFIDQ